MGIRAVAAALLCAGVGLCQAATPQHLAWVVAPDQPVMWRAMPVSGGAGAQGGGMAYPAPNLAGFLLAIATHAALQKGADEAERRVKEGAAEARLQPYQSVVSAWRQDRLARAALQHLDIPVPAEVVDDTARTPGWVVRSTPVFRLEPLERAVVLDNALTIQDVAGVKTVFEGVVRVISQPQMAESPQAAWLAQEGQALESEVARLLAHSVEIALLAARTPAPSPSAFKTQRFQFAADVKMERAAVVAPLCDRQVMVTLRDTWLSAPRQTGEAAPQGCSPTLRQLLSAPRP
jgi:hypothetical protein